MHLCVHIDLARPDSASGCIDMAGDRVDGLEQAAELVWLRQAAELV
jgi:hypothetical protein